jgi:hypothetical protein
VIKRLKSEKQIIKVVSGNIISRLIWFDCSEYYPLLIFFHSLIFRILFCGLDLGFSTAYFYKLDTSTFSLEKGVHTETHRISHARF